MDLHTVENSYTTHSLGRVSKRTPCTAKRVQMPIDASKECVGGNVLKAALGCVPLVSNKPGCETRCRGGV